VVPIVKTLPEHRGQQMTNAKISIPMLKRLIVCDPITGSLIWKHRTPDLFTCEKHTPEFSCKRWNARCAGKQVSIAINGSGYGLITIFYKIYRVHHVIWALAHDEWPTEIDHINHITTDNSIENLREVSRLENSRNLSLPVKNSSGHIGVHWHTRSRRWRAAIGVKGKKISIGEFKNIDDAIDARRAASLKYGFHKNHGLAK
jgi:hypothetical protein